MHTSAPTQKRTALIHTSTKGRLCTKNIISCIHPSVLEYIRCWICHTCRYMMLEAIRNHPQYVRGMRVHGLRKSQNKRVFMNVDIMQRQEREGLHTISHSEPQSPCQACAKLAPKKCISCHFQTYEHPWSLQLLALLHLSYYDVITTYVLQLRTL
jgi:hypothetical protein